MYSPETFDIISSTSPHGKAKSNLRQRTPQQSCGPFYKNQEYSLNRPE
jgi:hypothetical protein